jgi:hypothetical protein
MIMLAFGPFFLGKTKTCPGKEKWVPIIPPDHTPEKGKTHLTSTYITCSPENVKFSF